jgi:ATP-dependent DNA helicase RecG
MLCQKYYLYAGKSGVYTRKKGLDRETNKELLLKHIRANSGSRLSDLCQVLPSLSEDQIRTLIKELKRNDLIHVRGKTKAGLWFFGPEQSNLKPNSNLIPT